MTIFITISRGAIARNILQNEFYDLVKRNFTKVVLVTTAASDERFNKEFGAPNVEIIPMPEERDGFGDSLVNRFYKFLIFNSSTVGRGLYWYAVAPSRAAWLVKLVKFSLIRLVFQPLTKITALRRAIQWLDYRFLQSNAVRQYEALISKYKPAVIFVGSILEESALLKAARRQRVPTVAMPKTWDNPSKRYFRARADVAVVWSAFMQDQMIKLQDYRPSEIKIIGIPQYDYNLEASRLESREDFCRRLGLDPNKKILCYGSEGKVMPSDADVAAVLYDMVSGHKLSASCQILIRPHFGYKNDAQKFSKLLGKPDVVVDNFNNPSRGFRDEWDYSQAQMDHFLNIFYHSDIIMSTASTLALDASALLRPNILIMFDGYKPKPFFASGARWYVCDYFDDFMRYNAALVADGPESLRETINKLLENPRLLEKNQVQLNERFCYKLDGQAGRRLFQILYDYSQKH